MFTFHFAPLFTNLGALCTGRYCFHLKSFRGLLNRDLVKVVGFVHEALLIGSEVQKASGPKLVDWRAKAKEEVFQVGKPLKGFSLSVIEEKFQFVS